MHETDKKFLSGATLMAHIAWEAVQATGATKDPEALRGFEEMLRAGKWTLGIFIQRDAEHIFATAAAIPSPKFVDPFDGGGLVKVQGPVVSTVEQLKELTVIDFNKFN